MLYSNVVLRKMTIFWKLFSKKRTAVVVGIAFFTIGALAGVYAFSNKGLPSEFVSTRDKAAVVSQDIVNLTNQTNETLERANKLDIEGMGTQTLSIIDEARATNSGAYQKAFQLSGYLKDLAESLRYISNRESQRVAYEAIATELGLVSEFIVYTKNVSKFLDELSLAVSQNTAINRNAARSSLDEANDSAKKINALNNQFLQKMGEFDASVR